MPQPASLLANVRVLWPKGLNSQFYLDINNFARRTRWAHGFMHDYALWLGLVLMALTFLAAYVVVWWRRDTRSAALLGLGGVGTLIALGLNQVVGHAARELRPYDTYRHALVLVGKANDYSFPSDHSVVAGALLVSVLLVVRSRAPEQWGMRIDTPRWVGAARQNGATGAMAALALVGAVFCLFLCFARIYVGAHYPGDVVGGLLLGAVVVLLVSAARPLAFRFVDALDRSALAVLVHRPRSSGRSIADVREGADEQPEVV